MFARVSMIDTEGAGDAASRRTVRRTARLVAALSAAAAVVVGPAQAASADAVGQACQYVHVSFIPTPVPKTCLSHQILGPGRLVTFEHGEFASVNPICNWRIDWLYYDMQGRRYKTSYGSTHYTCDRFGVRNTEKDHVLKPGQACAKLLSNGAPTTLKQCHSING